MRFLLTLLTALCLSLLAAPASAMDTAAGWERHVTEQAAAESGVMPEVTHPAAIAGDSFDNLYTDADYSDAPVGYCNIWSADLFDPLDLLDEIEESSAIFSVPVVALVPPSADIPLRSSAQAMPPASAFYKPPISLA
jgi:hypothetical protein